MKTISKSLLFGYFSSYFRTASTWELASNIVEEASGAWLDGDSMVELQKLFSFEKLVRMNGLYWSGFSGEQDNEFCVTYVWLFMLEDEPVNWPDSPLPDEFIIFVLFNRVGESTCVGNGGGGMACPAGKLFRLTYFTLLIILKLPFIVSKMNSTYKNLLEIFVFIAANVSYAHTCGLDQMSHWI